MRTATLFCLAFFTKAAPVAAFPAHVVSCHDGDTCTVIAQEGAIKVRLAETDAPEIDQPLGIQARDVLCDLVCRHDVDIKPRGTSYDRIVGLIRVGGRDTSEAMVAAGAAWDDARYDSDPAMPALDRRPGQGSWGYGLIRHRSRLGHGGTTEWAASDHGDDHASLADQLVHIALDPARPSLQKAAPLMREDLHPQLAHVDLLHPFQVAHEAWSEIRSGAGGFGARPSTTFSSAYRTRM